MKKHIEKIKAKGPEHVNKTAKILAGITTLVIVIIWLVIVSVFSTGTEEEETVEPSNGPDINAFLQEAETSLRGLGNDYQQGADSFQESVNQLEEVESQEDENDFVAEETIENQQ